ncbi:MAG: hypothetical protein A3I05_02845 [Deltaproteobacteria bacterium RIFCSPLOWO2_02_FULL_44_10]|nr:MAG: hypothetical protein A3C46_03505 [Deltaproteobacteria bacterium RIFCSPHIGHO2_02_FULL_44_16]OGQ46551.1 MAG: hypothetical protein A3I05_02845 [Deltaproteobacteria bacterium RIFCSPLOWO2_02_FULL_44_10]
MKKNAKSEYLQIRISLSIKKKIQTAAQKAGLGMSEWIFLRLFPPLQEKFEHLVEQLAKLSEQKMAYAELHDFLKNLSAMEFEQAVFFKPKLSSLSELEQNYVVAMVEVAAHQKGIQVPTWTQEIAPLPQPYFGSSFKNLQLYLLAHSPVPFRRRNIFIDATIGERI